MIDFTKLENFKHRNDLPAYSGIYFVFGNNKLIYIGKAGKSIWERHRKHHRQKDFDKYKNIEYRTLSISTNNLNEIEDSFIKYYNPILNGKSIKSKYSLILVEWFLLIGLFSLLSANGYMNHNLVSLLGIIGFFFIGLYCGAKYILGYIKKGK